MGKIKQFFTNQRKYMCLATRVWQTNHGIVCFNYLGKGQVELSNGKKRLAVMSLDEALDWAAPKKPNKEGE